MNWQIWTVVWAVFLAIAYAALGSVAARLYLSFTTGTAAAAYAYVILRVARRIDEVDDRLTRFDIPTPRLVKIGVWIGSVPLFVFGLSLFGRELIMVGMGGPAFLRIAAIGLGLMLPLLGLIYDRI